MKFRAFTIIELLVVLLLAGVLFCLVMPVFASTQRPSRLVHCKANMWKIRCMEEMYSADHDGWWVTPKLLNPNKLKQRSAWFNYRVSIRTNIKPKNSILSDYLLPYGMQDISTKMLCPEIYSDYDPKELKKKMVDEGFTSYVYRLTITGYTDIDENGYIVEGSHPWIRSERLSSKWWTRFDDLDYHVCKDGPVMYKPEEINVIPGKKFRYGGHSAWNIFVNPKALEGVSLQHGNVLNVTYGDGSVRSIKKGEHIDQGLTARYYWQNYNNKRKKTKKDK